VKDLLAADPSEVVLYLATRPQDYLWYLERFAPLCHRVAIDKPLATDEVQMNRLHQFAELNRQLDIRPIDHYLFKRGFGKFNENLEQRSHGLSLRDLREIEITIHEEGLDAYRKYFIETGIIRDMMPHVLAMVHSLFHYARAESPLQVHIGNVLAGCAPVCLRGTERAIGPDSSGGAGEPQLLGRGEAPARAC
jgi:glucose-6-phosphate 1-dehydrogenase